MNDSSQLDAWLAEHLFGFVGTALHRSDPARYGWGDVLRGAPVEPTPYSTSYEGMGLVIEAMREREDTITIDFCDDGDVGAYIGPHGFGSHKSAPMAVAIAARAALESDEAIRNAGRSKE